MGIVEEIRGCGGAHNAGVCTLKSAGVELVLKLVKSQAIIPGTPSEAANLIKISQDHPSIVQDSSVAFPHHIVRLQGSRQNHRYDVIVMKKASGQGLAQVIQKKWRAGLVPEVMTILEKVGECLGDFHQRYGGKQHGDLTPNNVLYDEATGCVTFIDLGGMGTSCSEGDVSYFSKSLSLSARLMGHQLETQGVRHFKEGHAKSIDDSAKASCAVQSLDRIPKSVDDSARGSTSKPLCVSQSLAQLPKSRTTSDFSTARHTVTLGSCRVVSAQTRVSHRRSAPFPTLLLSSRAC